MTLFTDHCHGRPLLVTQSWKIAGSGRLNVEKATKNPQSRLAASRGDNSGMQFRKRSRRHLVVKCPPPGNRSHPLPLVGVVDNKKSLLAAAQGRKMLTPGWWLRRLPGHQMALGGIKVRN